jgi:hypothetical protein
MTVLTHRRRIHLLANERTHLCRVQYLSPIQNSYPSHQRHDPKRLAVFHLHDLNSHLFISMKIDERTSLLAPY